MLTSSVLLGVVVGLLRGGSLKGLAALRVRLWWVLLLAFLAKFLLVKAGAGGVSWAGVLEPYVNSGVYAASLSVLLLNSSLPWLKLILVGTLLNMAVVMLNGGRMPVSEEALASLGKYHSIEALRQGLDVTHTFMDASTVAGFLGDWITVPIPLPSVVSVGDLVVSLGAVLLVNAMMTTKTLTVESPE